LSPEAPRRIVAIDYKVGNEHWATWPAGQEAQHAERVAAEVASTPVAREVVRRWVHEAPSKVRGDGTPAGLMLWVPDPTTGEVGWIGSVWVLGWPGVRPTRDEYVAQAQAFEGDAGMRVLHHRVVALDDGMAGGPGVIESLVVAPLRSSLLGRVKEGPTEFLLRGTVFPDGASEAVRVLWNPTDERWWDDAAMQSEAGGTLRSVVVTLGEP